MTDIEFQGWPSTPRLFRQTWITEKIDGTNASIVISKHNFGTHVDGVPPEAAPLVFSAELDESGLPAFEYLVYAQSRKRVVCPAVDNFGFAQWVWDNAESLADTLGEGRHFGEWWGAGIQRGYNQTIKKFSLFNTRRWWFNFPDDCGIPELDVVPVLHIGAFDSAEVLYAMDKLRSEGSSAAPGFMKPEGVCVYHEPAKQVFKALLENDDVSKTEAATL